MSAPWVVYMTENTMPSVLAEQIWLFANKMGVERFIVVDTTHAKALSPHKHPLGNKADIVWSPPSAAELIEREDPGRRNVFLETPYQRPGDGCALEATSLLSYKHPPRACYWVGKNGGGLRCHAPGDWVYLPMPTLRDDCPGGVHNDKILAVALYDRLAKEQ